MKLFLWDSLLSVLFNKPDIFDIGQYSKQDQTSNRHISILQWLWMENGLVITDSLTHSHTPNLEMLSHLKKIPLLEK